MRVKISFNPPLVIRLILVIISIILFIAAFWVLVLEIIKLFLLTTATEDVNFNPIRLFSVLPFTGLAFLFYFESRKRTLIEFNSRFLYITDKDIEEKIELKDIIEIRQEGFGPSGSNRPFYTIKYYDLDKNITSIKINTLMHTEEMDRFKYRVKNAKSQKRTGR
jgi:hypothetical protein